MTPIAPIKLILDISTLSATTTREWLGFSRAGDCYLPHVVYEEIRFLYERSPDPDLERVAREFNRFYSHSGWHISEVTGHHPLLKAATTQSLTKRSRVALAVARCAYGEAQANPKQLIVLTTSDRSILQRVYDLQIPNLAGIQSAALLQWSRNGERPIAVSQKLQQLRDFDYAQTGILGQPYRPTSPTRTARTRTTAIPSRPTTLQHQQNTRIQNTRLSSRSGRTTHLNRGTKVTKYVAAVPPWVSQLMSILSAFAALAVAGLIIWVLFFTSYFDRFLPKDESAPVSMMPISTAEWDIDLYNGAIR
ncbi:MAG: hypothetical protein F6K36_29845 [Symploca sp. SIO3C6]|nr:hypothetical protein [Symploca sp. SIO3C6]